MKNILPCLAVMLLTAPGAMAQTTCLTAQPITPGLHVVAAIDGLEIPQPSCAGNYLADHGNWYSYTPTHDTIAVVSTNLPVNGNVDTRFHIYTGSCGSLVCVGGDDDSGLFLLSVDTMAMLANVQYLIAFDDLWSANGFTFELKLIPPPVQPPSSAITFSSVILPVYSDCVVDMNGDHLDDAVGVTNQQVNIAQQLPGGGFQLVAVPTPLAMFMPTWSIAAGDIDRNGYNDLVYGSTTGATFMLRSNDASTFIQQGFTEYIFSQRTNFIDINNDGHLDAFICHEVAANVYFLNDGLGNLTFHQGGLGETAGNYGSIWIDYDNDGDMDLFIAKCGSDPVDLLMRNNGDGTFTDMAPAYGMADNHQAWSSAWGDFDNDGDMDVLIGVNGAGYHKLLRNDLGSFTDITSGSGLTTPITYGREWITHDFNNDGWLDILGHNVLFLNNGDMTFTATGAPANGPIGDLNNDGFLDIVNGNQARLNNGNDNHWLKVHTVGTVSNINGIGARVTITSALGTQIREVRSGDGFKFMSSLTTHFGLGPDTEVYELSIRWPSGIITTILNPAIDQLHVVVEEFGTGMDLATLEPLGVYPNPARDQVSLTGTLLTGSTIVIYDNTGRLVERVRSTGTPLNIGHLAPGFHTIQAITPAGPAHVRFMKE